MVKTSLTLEISMDIDVILTSVTFENPNNWYTGSNAGAKNIAISSSALSNTSTAATYLRSTYTDKYWSRS